MHSFHYLGGAALAVAFLLLAQPLSAQSGQDFTDKDLSGKDMTGQNLSGANFTDATLKQTKFDKADLSGANFTDADLSGATFTDANLSGANLQDAIIPGAFFARANLSKANLRGTKKFSLSGVATLRGADLRKVDVSGSAGGIDFREADLRGARLTDVYSLADARIKRAKYDKTTQFPKDFNPEEAGLVLAGEAEAPEESAAQADVGVAADAKPAPAVKPATAGKPAAKLDQAALVKSVTTFLQMLDEARYDESFEAAAPSFREGLTKEKWAANLKANRATLGTPTDRTAKKFDSTTNLETGKKSYVVPVTSVFANGTVTETLTVIVDEDGEYRVADYSLTTSQ